MFCGKAVGEFRESITTTTKMARVWSDIETRWVDISTTVFVDGLAVFVISFQNDQLPEMVQTCLETLDETLQDIQFL